MGQKKVSNGMNERLSYDEWKYRYFPRLVWTMDGTIAHSLILEIFSDSWSLLIKVLSIFSTLRQIHVEW